MLSRIIVALIGIPILVLILYHGGFPLLIFANIIIGIGTYEFYQMSEIGGKKPHKILGMAMALLVPNIIFFRDLGTISIGIEGALALGIILVMSVRIFQNRVEDASFDIGVTLLGATYVSVLFSHILLISNLPNGGKWLLTIQILVWVCDSLAYFVGIGIGRRIFNRGFNSISPKKSIEGSLGGMFFTVVALFLLDRFFHLTPNGMSVANVIFFGVFISLVAQIGDLGESMYKREFKVKDSGHILGGHGGILDRFDSLFFVAPVTYYLLKFFIL